MRGGLAAVLLALWSVIAAGSTADAKSSSKLDPALRRALAEALADTPSFQDRFDAEVWLVDMSGRLARWVGQAQERSTMLAAIHREASRSNLNPQLVLALIHVESRYDRFALSPAGARGLMQIMPFWLNEIGRPEANLFDVDTNLRIGCTILRHYLDRERGNLFRALGRYNGTLGNARYPNKVFNARQRIWYTQ